MLSLILVGMLCPLAQDAEPQAVPKRLESFLKPVQDQEDAFSEVPS